MEKDRGETRKRLKKSWGEAREILKNDWGSMLFQA